ncbi:TPA: hypothetical protein KOY69_002024 [Clostridioides difficile]|nr:hypothetical protein [Clostridioides difficile]HBF8167743.1 hypothetical protein [Clostridioides difficile]
MWLYSWDDEYFASDEYESKEEAIEAAKEELRRFGKFGRLVYVEKKEEVNIPNIDAEEALESVQNEIDNEFGGYGEDWFVVTDTEEIELKDAINEN